MDKLQTLREYFKHTYAFIEGFDTIPHAPQVIITTGLNLNDTVRNLRILKIDPIEFEDELVKHFQTLCMIGVGEFTHSNKIRSIEDVVIIRCCRKALYLEEQSGKYKKLPVLSIEY